jgi:two-component system KDP operon response regulator KdpE
MSDFHPIILIIDAERPMRRLLRTVLLASGYQVLEAASAPEGLTLAETRLPEIILLDPKLPDLDGLEVTRRVRMRTQTPIIILSARGQESTKLAAFDAGVDDDLVKPFGVRELLARMRLALRHAARPTPEPDEPVLTVGQLRVDLGRQRVYVAEQAVHLTPIEYRLLATLMRG